MQPGEWIGRSISQWNVLVDEAHRLARNLGLNGANADDYVSNFLLKCLNIGPEASIRYLVRSGHHAGLDYLKSEHVRQGQQGSTPPREITGVAIELLSSDARRIGQRPEGILLRRELNLRIETAIARLTREQQRLWRLAIVDGRSHAEIASILGRSPQAVRQAIFTIRRQLRTLLERQGVDYEIAKEYLYEIGILYLSSQSVRNAAPDDS